ncbi:MAG TPA: HAMP domain-containing sensor histidine kinase [Alphaproteobacteria bacterium]|nr:HAMP domain-containing sensor histidine kinase [Alphaproteobacteria bacterium]
MSRFAPGTLTRTLTVRLIAVATFVAIAQMAVVLVYYAMRTDKTGVLIALHEAEAVAAHVHVTNGLLTAAPGPAFERHYTRYPSDYGLQVIDSNGSIAYALNGELIGDLKIDLEGQPDVWTKIERRASGTFRVTAKRFEIGAAPFWVAFGMGHDPAHLYADQMIDEMLDHVVEPMLPLFAFMLLVSAFVIRRSLRPLTRAAEAAAKLDPRDHQMRLPADGLPKEVAELVRAINTSLAHLQEVFEDQRQFLATAAHELRTPLAILTLQLDRLSGPTLPALRADVEHMTRLVNQLLLVARLDALPTPHWAEIELTDLAKSVVSRLAPLASLERKALEFVDEGDTGCQADVDMISDALRNVVENAIRYAPDGSTVRITAGPGARLAVDDAGPGIPESDQMRLHQRVWRSPKRSESGAGLGLFIVGKVVAAHHGSAHICRSPLGGARVELSFPPVPPVAETWPSARLIAHDVDAAAD